ncbi:MAG TPA: transposase [Solirubrobacteraceae bacterium]|nr:transposase [Solirubrobacteraceae bacterium]
MGRARAEDPEGAIYHVWARGNDRAAIFRDDADRACYLGLLMDVARRTSWRCLAYCLMGTHIHLIVETDRADLGHGVQLLHGRYARAFNRRHDRVGHLFQGRFGSRVVEDDGHLCMLVRYVALNPVAAGLCSRADEWPWASCAATAGDDAPAWLDVDRLLGHLAAHGGDPRTTYRDLIAAPSP